MSNPFSNNPSLNLLRDLNLLKQRVERLETLESGALSGVAPIATVWFDGETEFDSDWWPNLTDPNSLYNFYAQQQNPMVGNEFSSRFWLRAGTYEFSVLGVTNTDVGQMTWYIDGAVVVADQEWYDTGLTYNVIKTETVDVVTSGLHTLRGVVSGKHDDSSNYYQALTKAWFRPS